MNIFALLVPSPIPTLLSPPPAMCLSVNALTQHVSCGQSWRLTFMPDVKRTERLRLKISLCLCWARHHWTPLSSAGRRRRRKRSRDRPFVLVIVTCVFVFLFVFLISLLRLLFCRQTLLGKTIDTRSVGRMGRLGGLGFGSSGLGLNLFGPSSWPLKLFSRVRQMHPGGRFHFVICVFDILLKCCWLLVSFFNGLLPLLLLLHILPGNQNWPKAIVVELSLSASPSRSLWSLLIKVYSSLFAASTVCDEKEGFGWKWN